MLPRPVSGQDYVHYIAVMGALLGVGLLTFAPHATSTDQFLPHAFCYAWQPGLIRLNLISDSLIGAAYVAIPITLFQFIRKRSDIPFNWMFALFAVFIVACGATHWIEVWTLWNPSYWLAGSVKAVTAAASVPTAVLLFFLLPKALLLPSVAQLEAAKRDLEQEIERRKRVEAALEKSHRDLEDRVDQRTAQLTAANEQLERQRSELEAASRAKTEFLAVLSHELRNPVHAIQVNCQVIAATVPGDAKERAASAIQRQIAKLRVLLQELLDVATMSRTTLNLQPVDLVSIVKAAVETVASQFRERGHYLDVDLPARAVMVQGNAERLEQAVANLLGNANKYTPSGGHVWVSISATDDQAVVSVRDDGVGIPSEELPMLFGIFSRGSAARRLSADGLGLGLHIADAIIKAHAGSIRAASAGPGKGSEFMITLPRADRASTASAPSVEAITPRPEPLDVLIVDDNRDAADALRHLVELDAHHVSVCYDGPQAIEQLRTQRFDVALIDIGLPTIDGYEVARSARESDTGYRPLLVAVTGWGADEDKARARAAGFDCHLTKPVKFEDLTAALALIDAQAGRSV